MFTRVMLNTLVNYQHVSKGLTWTVFVPSHNGETHGRVLERASREQLVSAHLEGHLWMNSQNLLRNLIMSLSFKTSL